MSTRSKAPAHTCSTTWSARSQRWQPSATYSRTLGIEAPGHGRLRDALDREPVRGHPHARALLLLRRDRLLEGAGDDVVEPLVHLFLLPEVLLEALHPLEVGDDDAAGVRKHVREDEDPAVLEDLVGARRDRAVRALADDSRLHVGGVLVRDHLLERARSQDVAWTPPRESETAMTTAPRSWSRRARLRPTLPKPCTTTRRPSSFLSS